MDALRFRSQTEKHGLSYLCEAKMRNMGNAECATATVRADIGMRRLTQSSLPTFLPK